MPTKARPKISQLSDLVSLLNQSSNFANVANSLKAGQAAAVDGAWGSSCALSAAALSGSCAGTLLVVLPRIRDVDEYAADLAGFVDDVPLIFPAWETLPDEHTVADAVFGGRLRILRALHEEDAPTVVVTSLPALLQPVPSAEERQAGSQSLKVGDELDTEEFIRRLINRGFDRVTAIELPGEFSLHGGILDIYPPDALDPYRIELFGDEIESIRTFDVETQRKVEELSDVILALVSPTGNIVSATGKKSERVQQFSGECFLDSLPAESWVALIGLQDVIDEGKHYLDRLSEKRGLYSVDSVMAEVTKLPTVTIAPLAADSMETTCHLSIESIERFTGPKQEVIQELSTILQKEERVLIACQNEGELSRLNELVQETDKSLAKRITLCSGFISRGFRLVHDQIAVLSDAELFGRSNLRRSERRRKVESRAIDSFLELRENELVVHLTNGIGRYLGMELLEKDGHSEEHLQLEFRDSVRVFVPVSLIHLVQKYVGGAKSAPRLSKLGGTAWSKKKQKAAESVKDMAAEMLRLQAGRSAKLGIACPPDSTWQQEFEAAFPYTETGDQLAAITDIKDDMERPQPMDRLICGDVGYGKTEVAIRGAFKAIEAGKQVAVLVPTTVLAEQHFRTFSDRMAEYPVSIEMLSRFRTKAEQRETLKGMKEGAVDLVIGTHRLVQQDVRFKDLGLIIIDEEQRFGVAAKEILMHMRLEVDVLTLSATPIPRTLHMSLLGIRDISNLMTAPQDRIAVETRLCRFDTELIRQAIVRELNRNGQVFFVHNRVFNIRSIADRIQTIVPEASIGICHGQMKEHELEEGMVNFVSGKTDVLVCTTIIESGLDIPNANTIFIHQADNYGLADLHQLRGRVGRYKNRAYCYLLLEEGRTVTPIAAKRLKAIEEFSELGAGFQIAMRDLEIRGAGNLLGTEQSGHISAVGYELYCQLLENAVRQLKREPIREYQHVVIDVPSSAYLPDSFVPPGRHKIELYRRLSSVKDLDELAELNSEMLDRFGPIPEETARLLEVKKLQILCQKWQIDHIHLEDRFAVFGYRNEQQIRELSALCEYTLRIVDRRSAYLILPDPEVSSDQLVLLLQRALTPAQQESSPAAS